MRRLTLGQAWYKRGTGTYGDIWSYLPYACCVVALGWFGFGFGKLLLRSEAFPFSFESDCVRTVYRTLLGVSSLLSLRRYPLHHIRSLGVKAASFVQIFCLLTASKV